ncbi:MAG: fasciclin domain-containing protein [Planctomycetota bacterium]
MLKNTPTTLISALVATSLSFGTAMAQKHGEPAPASHPRADIVGLAQNAGGFSTLLAAAKAAGLVDALKSEGPLTVFAPNDAAFAKLPKGTVESLLLPENKDKLTAVLTYHVVPGRFDAKHVVAAERLTTLLGQDLTIEVGKDQVMVAGARVIATDLMASNGIVHVIDSVMLPKSAADANDIVTTAANAGNFTTLLAACKAAGLADTLCGEGPFTVLAPTDDAFAKLPKGTVQSLLLPENKAKLVSILKLHVIAGNVDAKSAIGLGNAPTLLGQDLPVRIEKGQLTIGTAKVIANDIGCKNGVIHAIDSVLLPK